ncbi:carbohydrate ABC transporter ATP-binding protein (CUT1 family) [Aminobacter aminovorans]|uniref:sn-glycerol-3-phosphate import ATP-binding protein UgpC n=1 Tax=Aminobacter aminovorans TaxID=83263 RepID=A0A380WQE0_AMIAI|nr:sn-glycerol-3-phosphate ABC transporter ATP-binding protein UgpC [Aminobacter aminovorans]TCS29713.1 carbohydrate ABC transporter ATP-binding protein (CUT1 family) [Aminobacter aminovorans]SUU90562.1 sn-glycerol-3-phosphate import ATP-binding protein UgpC [Aminobacter aminovorans]
MSALDIQNIRKSYGAVETLKGIDIALQSGEFLVLLGSSGCGKSTLLNIIAGLAEATSGDVRIAGRSILGVHPKDRDIAMVFQSYALYPNLSVRRNIGFGLEMRKVPLVEREKAVEEASRLLQIEPLLDRKPSQLSGGQRQRVAIGRALVRKPEVFLFDEPLSNLDAKLRLEMRTELKRLHQMLKTTVVYVTHDQIEAMTLATRIAVMKDGRIEQLGTPEEIYNQPATLYVAGFVGAPPMNILDVEVDDGALRIVGSDIRLPLPDRFRTLIGDKARLALGIRPEALRLASLDQAGGHVLPVRIEVVELTGPELVATARLGQQKLIACLAPRARVGQGDVATFTVDDDALHLFDPADGLALLA